MTSALFFECTLSKKPVFTLNTAESKKELFDCPYFSDLIKKNIVSGDPGEIADTLNLEVKGSILTEGNQKARRLFVNRHANAGL